MSSESFTTLYRGSFSGVLRWPQFDQLWSTLAGLNDGRWYLYLPGSPPPQQPCPQTEFGDWLERMAISLKAGHPESHCGLVYVDHFEAPSLVKIFDPSTLGTACGSGDNPPLPGWILSRFVPASIELDTQKKPFWFRWIKPVVGVA